MFLLLKKIKDKLGTNRLFLILVCLIFLFVSILDSSKSLNILNYFCKNLSSLIPILLFVYLIIFGFSLILSNKKITNFLSKWHYVKKMFLAIIGWIVSSGPVYLWFGFLKDLHKSGLSLGHIAGFSYARAIKIPLIPMMIVYFWLKFSVIFILVLFALSFLQCLIIDIFDKYRPLD